MLYRNIKTGAVIEFKSRISSDVWEPVEKQAPKTVFEAQVKVAAEDEKVEVAPVQPKKTTSKKKKAD